MYNFSGVFESWRICFSIAIGIILVCVISSIFKTCKDIAICKDEFAIPTSQYQSSENKIRRPIIQKV